MVVSPSVEFLSMDVRDGLPLANESVHSIVTSPPYWGLRDYHVNGQLGMERSPEEYVGKLVAMMREMRRVLRREGTLWLVIGDSYANSWPCSRRNVIGQGPLEDGRRDNRPPRLGNGLKDKDLCMIPARAALALQADGWRLRQDIIWAKPNAMPESVRDRCTRSHEYVYLLTKSARYYWDRDAILEPSITSDPRRPYTSEGAWEMDGRPREQRHGGEIRGKGGRNAFRGQGAERDSANGPANRSGRDMRDVGAYTTRNKRDVWTVATRPYRGAHFATFPPALIRPMILAGCPLGGTVLDPFCGSGTVGEVAMGLGRNAILNDINPDYVIMAMKRCGCLDGLEI